MDNGSEFVEGRNNAEYTGGGLEYLTGEVAFSDHHQRAVGYRYK